MKIWTGISFILVLTAYCAYTDIRNRKVYNKTLLFGLVVGVAISMLDGRLSQLSILGFILPFIVHMVPFKMRLVSAGDVKLYMVVGLFAGMNDILYCMAYSYLIGGLAALFLMLKYGELKVRLQSLKWYFIECFITKRIIEYTGVMKRERSLPFALMIHLAVIVMILERQQMISLVMTR